MEKVKSISLETDLSIPERKDLETVRALRKGAQGPAVTLRAAALGMIEEALLTGQKADTQQFRQLCASGTASMVNAVRTELRRLRYNGPQDLGSDYLQLEKPKAGEDLYRFHALRSYFRGEPVSP